MEDILDIHHLHLMEVYRKFALLPPADAFYFLSKHRKVELCRVETGKVAVSKPVYYLIRYLTEGRAICKILSRNSMYGLCRRSDRSLAVSFIIPWLDAPCLYSLLTAGQYLDKAELNYRV